MTTLKHLILVALLTFTSIHSFAAVSDSAQNRRLLIALQKNEAVIGALSIAKKWAGTSACKVLRISSFDGENFVVVGSCIKPDSGKGDVGDSAEGQILVTGTISKDDVLVLESIEFLYAG